ncbi:MAG: exosome complex protein Rrp4 [Methanobrevibacter sp.]|nr:exosome complex protein Rrp4 [Methanobrevibacter sp.]
MIYVNEKDLVVPGELLAEDDYYPGRGTFEDDGKICSKLLGLVSLRNKKISVIPLKSKYLPKKGDVVIGKIDDVRFSMWGVDINSPYSGILPASEVFGREKKELSRVFDIGDVLFLRIVDVDEVKKVKLGLKGRGMGKFKGGVIVDIAPTKVPRLIGKKGSMINMIKDKTGCKIVVGQNGLVWVKGNEDMEQIVKNIIKLIEKEAHTSGLTDRIKNKLCLLIDGELPPEEEEVEEVEEEIEEDAFEDGLKKPELQDFRDEVEKELAEEGFIDEDSEEDLDDDSEDDEFEEDLEDFNDETEDYEDIDEEDLDDEDSEEEDKDDDLETSDDDIEDFEDDISDEELEDVISDAISEDGDEIVEESEDEEDSEDDSEVEEDSEDDEDLDDSEEESVEESEDEENIEEDSEESPEEEDEEAVEESEDEENEDENEETSEDDSKDEKSKKPNFMDTYEYINEQKKNNKSSFDLSRADNSKSPTLNISQGRGI